MSETAAGGGLLQRLSDEMAGAVETAGASIVRINARRRLPATGIVWASDEQGATIVSANHVIERDEEITVVAPDGRELSAQLVGRDPGSDLALLRVAGAALTPATRAPEGAVKVGALVLALGRAGALAATFGIVSAPALLVASDGRALPAQQVGRGRRLGQLISSDAPMFPGFSGGPLVDASGRVIGLLSSHLGRGMTLAIPHAEVERIVAALKAHGRVARGYLGIGAQPVALPAALRAHADQAQGLLLVTVEDDGPASKAGLTVGDIIVRLGADAIGSLDELRAGLTPERVGQPVPVRILRGGQPIDLTVTPVEQK